METLPIEEDCREGFKKALLAAIDVDATRETLLGQVFTFLDECINELTDSGRLAIEPAPTGESHLDKFVVLRQH